MSILNKASLVITPTAYKEDKLYSIIPKDGSGDLTWTRATDATRVNKDGYVERVCWNLLSYSEEFDNASWNKTRSSVSSNIINGPFGILNGYKLIEDTSISNTHQVTKNYTFTTGMTYTFSAYVKAKERFKGTLYIFGKAGTEATFDLQLQTISKSQSLLGSTIQNVGNDWFRVSITWTYDGVGGAVAIALHNGISGAYTGDGVSGFYIWGAQLVEGSTPKDYFLTTDRLNVPRINYPTTGGTPSILIEPQRTNLFLQSNNLATTPWYNYSETNVTENFDTFRNFGVNKIVSLGGLGRLGQTITTTIGQTYTVSFWCKNIDATAIKILVSTSSSFNYNYISLINTSNYSFISYSFIAGSTSTIIQVVRDLVSGESVLIQGAQLEVGSNATSYIPTTTSTVTRNADFVGKTNISDLIGQTEGTLFADFNYQKNDPNDDNFIAILSDNSSNNGVWIDVNNSNTFVAIIRAGGVSSVSFYISSTNFQFGRKKIAFSYKSGATSLYINGAKIGVTNTNAFTFNNTVSKFNLGCFWNNSSYPLNNTINSSAIFKQALTDAECITLTTL